MMPGPRCWRICWDGWPGAFPGGRPGSAAARWWPGCCRRRCCSPPSRSWPAPLLDRAHALGIRAAFVAGDEVYGGRELRRGIRQHGMGYVMAVRANQAVTASSGRTLTAAAAAGLIPVRAWHRMRTGSGIKGTRHYDWAMLEVTSDDTPEGHGDGHSVLLARRHRYTRQLSFYRCWTPGPVPLSRLIAIASARWRIEEDHQLSV
jgi:hypothetical protein